MNQTIHLTASKRDLAVRSRLIRRDGKVPAIMYGRKTENIPLSLVHKDFFKSLENESIYTSRLRLTVDDTSYSVLLKDVQRHPYKKQVLHVDFLQVTGDTVVTVHVPIHFLNENLCFGVKNQGGIINHQMIEVEIKCSVGDLPEYIAVDMAACKVGDVIHLSDLQLPAKAIIPMLALGEDHDLPVARVVAAHDKSVDEQESEAPA